MLDINSFLTPIQDTPQITGETLTPNAGMARPDDVITVITTQTSEDAEPTTIDMATIAVSPNSGGSTREDAGQTIQPPNQSAGNPTDADKTESIGYELAERMAIEGENCELNQVKPYVTDFDVLVIPSNGDPKYRYWNGGQSVCDTLRELGRCDLIPKYTSPYFNGN